MTPPTLPSRLHRLPLLGAALLLATLPSSPLPARAAGVELLSRVDPTMEADTGGAGDLSRQPASADGRYVVLESLAPHVVAGATDTNRSWDVFLVDRLAGTTTLVSHAAGNFTSAAAGASRAAAISADGRYVAFESTATNLVANQADANGIEDVFLFDRMLGLTVLVSHVPGSPAATGNYQSYGVSISDDGSVLAYESAATDLVNGQVDVNGFTDVFRYERGAGTNLLVSHAAGLPATEGSAPSGAALVGGNGRFIAFQSAAVDLVPGQVDSPGTLDVFRHDDTDGSTALASHAAGALTTSSGSQSFLAQNASGRVLFTSQATNLVAGQVDAPFTMDVFEWVAAGTDCLLVSHAAGAQATAANDSSGSPVTAGTGRFVAFLSIATDLVAGQVDTPSTADVFLWDRLDGSVALLSHLPGAPASTAHGESVAATISDDGARVAWVSAANDLVAGQNDPPGSDDVFLWEAASGTAELVSHVAGQPTTAGPGVAFQAALIADGATLLYTSDRGDLDATIADTDGVRDTFAYAPAIGESTALSLRDPARPSATGAASAPAERGTTSADGRYVVVESYAVNLVPGQVDAPGTRDVFLVDRITGTTTLVAHTAGSPATVADAESGAATISADGGWVAFTSGGRNLVAGQVDTNDGHDVFLFQRATGTVTLLSHAFGLPLQAGDDPSSRQPALSSDGRHVAFASLATDLLPGTHDGSAQIYLVDRVAGTTTLVTHQPGQPEVPSEWDVGDFLLSADGAVVAFLSRGQDLVAGQVDANGDEDVFLWSRADGAIVLASHAAGDPARAAAKGSDAIALSSDGRRVAFRSKATDLVAGATDTNNREDVFLYDRLAATMTLVSHAAGLPATAANGESDVPALSQDGALVAFVSVATNLVAGAVDTNSDGDVFLYDAATGALRLVSHRPGQPLEAGLGGDPRISADGSVLTFWSYGADLVAGQVDANGTGDVFVWRRDLDLTSLASTRSGQSTTAGDGASSAPRLSADGRVVAFSSVATDLVASDFNGDLDAFAFAVPGSLLVDGFESGTTSAWSGRAP
jgi:Tol biopolymer transport system component